MSAPLLAASVEQLATALAVAWSNPTLNAEAAWRFYGPRATRAAETMLASGVVVPLASLADDEALVDRVGRGLLSLDYADAPHVYAQTGRAALSALIAALGDQ